jgi:hypothetical protein
MEQLSSPVILPENGTWPQCLDEAAVQYVSQIPAKECIKVTIYLFLEQSKKSGDLELAQLARDIAKHADIPLTVDG